jgi:hypothetical protein
VRNADAAHQKHAPACIGGRSAHCMRTVPRGRVWWEAGSLVPITVSSTTRFLPYLHYAHYFPLLATSTPTTALVIGPPLGLPARPGKRPDRCDSYASLPTFQNAKRPSVRRLVKAFSPCCSSSGPALAELLRCKRSRVRSFEDPPDLRFRRVFLHLSTVSTRLPTII